MKPGGLLIFALLLTILASLLYVRTRFLLVELSYDVSQKRLLKTKLEQNRRALQLELATLQSPRRIEEYAKQELNLKQPVSAVSIVVVKEKDLK